MKKNIRNKLWKIVLMIFGIVIGLLFINQYQAQKNMIYKTKRDATLSLVNQLSLLVTTNKSLKNEISKLKSNQRKLQAGIDSAKLVKNTIRDLDVSAGNSATEGEGVLITLDLPLESFWIIDIINDLFADGAESIALNDELVTEKTSFIQNESMIYLNGKKALKAPFVFAVLGDRTAIEKALQKPDSILNRLKDTFPGQEDGVVLASYPLISLPARNR